MNKPTKIIQTSIPSQYFLSFFLLFQLSFSLSLMQWGKVKAWAMQELSLGVKS